MKVWISRYLLQSAFSQNQGALFKFEFTDQMTGYADLHPWPTLRDAPLEKQLENILKGEFSSQFRKTMLHAQIDAAARSEKKSVFNGLQIPHSHFFTTRPEILDREMLRSLYEQGFRFIKIKLGREELQQELKKIVALYFNMGGPDIKLRLDFNSKYTYDQILEFLIKLKKNVGHLNFIDFLEDPCDFDPKNWSELKKIFGVRLALDRQLFHVPSNERMKMKDFSDVLVFKPAIQLVEETTGLAKTNGLKIVVTSYLDHALGIFAACWEAAIIKKKYPELLESCGLLSHMDFRDDGFFSKIKTSGPQIVQPGGVGFGFDQELSKIKWEFFL